MTGFAITEVQARGQGMQDASVQFSAGLSLLTGPSDTGKSLVADAINHVFGSSGPLREIVPEQQRYDRLLVEIREYATARVFTLERAWAGGGIQLYDTPIADAGSVENTGRYLKEIHDGTTDSVSGFLLKLSELLDRRLRRNDTGGSDSLSFRNLPIYTLVEEERIITKLSPLLSGIPTEKTKELSLFKLLLTGVDDSAIIAGPDVKTRKGLDAGRKEVIESLLSEVQARINAANQTEEELNLELKVVEDALVNQTLHITGASVDIERLEEDRKRNWDNRHERTARLEQVRELIERFTLLDSHYDADMARLESTQESGQLLVQIEEGPCPLCGAEPEQHKHEGLLKSEDVLVLTNACRAEREKLKVLKSELQSTLARLGQEQSDLVQEIQAIDSKISSIQHQLTKELGPRVKATREGLQALFDRRKQAERGISDYEQVRRLESARAEFEIKAKQEAEKRVFQKAPPVSATEELAKLIGDILGEWNYPNLDRVVFDSASNDIVINGKPRASHGKGYRAITYSAFMIGVMRFCRNRGLPHPGFIVLDSPLVTYRKPDKVESNDDLISEGMVPKLFEYLSRLPEDCQVIVLENEEPTEDIRAKSTYTHFTRREDVGRRGFLLPVLI